MNGVWFCFPAMATSSEIRGDLKARLSGALAGYLIRLVGMTLRLEVLDRARVTKLSGGNGPVVLYALWHNRVFIMPYVKAKLMKRRKVTVLTSASKDGAILAGAVGVCGMDAARGSSSRRAVAALVALRKAVRAGSDVCITPDGPRGPVYEIQPGIVKLAESTGAGICVIRVDYEKFWRLKSWDGFMIPKPFSNVQIVFEDAFEVEPGMDLEAVRRELAERMGDDARSDSRG